MIALLLLLAQTAQAPEVAQAQALLHATHDVDVPLNKIRFVWPPKPEAPPVLTTPRPDPLVLNHGPKDADVVIVILKNGTKGERRHMRINLESGSVLYCRGEVWRESCRP